MDVCVFLERTRTENGQCFVFDAVVVVNNEGDADLFERERKIGRFSF